MEKKKSKIIEKRKTSAPKVLKKEKLHIEKHIKNKESEKKPTLDKKQVLEFKTNIVNSVINQKLLTIPGVDKKKEIKIEISNNHINVSFSPIPFLMNVFEVCSRVQEILQKEVKEKFEKNIIINVIAN